MACMSTQVEVKVKTAQSSVTVQSTLTLSGITVPQNQVELAAMIQALTATIKKMIESNLPSGQTVQEVTIISVGDVVVGRLRRLMGRVLSNKSKVLYNAVISGNSDVSVSDINNAISNAAPAEISSTLQQEAASSGATGLQSATVESVGEVVEMTPTTPAILPPTNVRKALSFVHSDCVW